MAWWEGVDETRILIAPDPGGSGVGGRLLSLRHPKSGNATCYLLTDNGVLQELHWFKQPYTSWFLGDYVCQDGSLYTATPVDPVFILLPVFEEARMKKGDDPGKFRQLDEILFVGGYPGYHHLIPIAENCMQVICEIKEMGSSKFFRLDDIKVSAWLHCKISKLRNVLPSLDKNYAAQDEMNTLGDAVAILGEYLQDEPWLKLVCDHLKLNFQDITRKASDTEVLPPAMDDKFISSLSQDTSRTDIKTKKVGRQTKMAKVEIESRNIKEMFTRASRKRN